MPNVTLGIDHPVVTVRNFDRVREQYRQLGFAPSPVGYHPWGTVMAVMMFKDTFIELIAVHDATKFGTNSVNGFCYGRNVGAFTDRVEGLGLVALHSKDSRADHERLTSRGLKSQGLIDFRRDMKKPNGTPDVAIVSLGLFLNEEPRDVSRFICHQHRPEISWVPEWINHPNGVDAITAVTYLAERPADLVPRFTAFYGQDRVKQGDEIVEADSGCGVFRVVSKQSVNPIFGDVTLPNWQGDSQPHGIAITVSTPKFSTLETLWKANGIGYQKSPRGSWLVSPDQCSNVILEFEQAA